MACFEGSVYGCDGLELENLQSGDGEDVSGPGGSTLGGSGVGGTAEELGLRVRRVLDRKYRGRVGLPWALFWKWLGSTHTFLSVNSLKKIRQTQCCTTCVLMLLCSLDGHDVA